MVKSCDWCQWRLCAGVSRTCSSTQLISSVNCRQWWLLPIVNLLASKIRSRNKVFRRYLVLNSLLSSLPRSASFRIKIMRGVASFAGQSRRSQASTHGVFGVPGLCRASMVCMYVYMVLYPLSQRLETRHSLDQHCHACLTYTLKLPSHWLQSLDTTVWGGYSHMTSLFWPHKISQLGGIDEN